MKTAIKSVFLTTLFGFLFVPAFSQQQNYNKQWLQGFPRAFKTTFTTAGPVNEFWDSTYIQRFMCGHSNICTGAGDLILATDAGNIYGADKQIVDNGDMILSSYAAGYVGSFGVQTSIILPLGDSIYYVFNGTWSDDAAYQYFNIGNDNALPDVVLYNVVDMKQNNYAGKVIRKKVVALDSARLSASHMTAVRHGNGRDWWLVKQAAVTGGNTNKIYTFLVKQDTVIGPQIQTFPNTANGILFGSWSGQSTFNNSGTKYAAVDCMAYLFTADFDRCAGLFSNPQRYIVPSISPEDTTANGVCFSSNDSLLYINTFSSIYQLELNNTDSATAWYRVAGADTIASYFAQYLSMQLAHDQKIYIGNRSNGTSTMSVINNPNGKGALADFCPKCLRFPKFMNSNVGVTQPPNMPNYALGIDPACPPDPEAVAGINGVERGIKLYPNPASESVTIEYAKPGTLEIVDMTGRVVMQAVLPAKGGKVSQSIGELSPGIYLYRYAGRDGSMVAGRMVAR